MEKQHKIINTSHFLCFPEGITDRLSYAANPPPRKSFASADRSVVYTNKDQDYMDYVESFLINDGDIYSYDNHNIGNPKEIIKGGKFSMECYE